MFNDFRTISGQLRSLLTVDEPRTTPSGPEFATCIRSMARLISVFAAGAVAVCVGCGANTATQERHPNIELVAVRVEGVTAPATMSVRHNPADRGIRRDLNIAIAEDVDLRNRNIAFIVANGDVSVTGLVRTEEERSKINHLAMSIGGVKSVANALRVAD